MYLIGKVTVVFAQYPDGSHPGFGYQDDHLKQQGQFGGMSAEGQWGKMTTTTIKTTTRTYTAADGTLVTEVSCVVSSNRQSRRHNRNVRR